jgi:precorrin-4/cobalt-precorrin-4 C11-methyltransferase
MKGNKVYFIGAGPGSPDMLTLRGAELLADCSTVFVPPPFEETMSAHLNGKNLEIPFRYRFEELLERLESLLETGPVAFLVPGDLTFYSPFQPFVDVLGPRAEVIPGVGTANVASSLLGKTLDLPDVSSRAVIVSPRTLGDDGAVTIRRLAEPGVTLLIYMNNIALPELVADLRAGYGSNVPIAILHRLSLPGQEVVTGRLDDIVEKVGNRDFFNLDTEDKRPALTLVIVGETLMATADGEWWNYRYENVWKDRK